MVFVNVAGPCATSMMTAKADTDGAVISAGVLFGLVG